MKKRSLKNLQVFQIFTVIVTFIHETLKKERISSFDTERATSSKYSKHKDFRSAKRRTRGSLCSRHSLSLRKMSLVSSLLLQVQYLDRLVQSTYS